MLFKDVYIPRGWVQEMEVDRSVKKGEEMILSSAGTFKSMLKQLAQGSEATDGDLWPQAQDSGDLWVRTNMMD